MTTPLEARLLPCDPGALVCPNCGQMILRRHALAGRSFDFCERKVPGRRAGTRCNTHLFIARGPGDAFVIVVALRSAFDKDRLLHLLDAEEFPSSA